MKRRTYISSYLAKAKAQADLANDVMVLTVAALLIATTGLTATLLFVGI